MHLQTLLLARVEIYTMKRFYKWVVTAMFGALPYKTQQTIVDQSKHYNDIRNEMVGRFLEQN